MRIDVEISITLYVLSFSEGTKHIFTFSVLLPRWHSTGSWNPSLRKTKTCHGCWCSGDAMNQRIYNNDISMLKWFIRYPRVKHWGRMTHICVGNLTIIGPDNGLSPGRRQAIIWTNAGIFLIGPWGTNFSEILIGIQTFSFKKMHLKVSSAKRRPFCLGLNVLRVNKPIPWKNIFMCITHWGLVTYICVGNIAITGLIMAWRRPGDKSSSGPML